MPIKLSSLAPSPKGRRLLASMPFIATCHVAKRLQMTSINLSNYLRHLMQSGWCKRNPVNPRPAHQMGQRWEYHITESGRDHLSRPYQPHRQVMPKILTADPTAYVRAYRAKRKAAGLCTCCGKLKAPERAANAWCLECCQFYSVKRHIA